MSKPNKVNLRKWVEALRSGKYKQTRGALRDGDAFCCLGVACDISGTGKWSGGAFHGSRIVMPRVVVGWLGLDDSDPELSSPLRRNKRTASEFNDESKLTFAEIADAIEVTYGLKGTRK